MTDGHWQLDDDGPELYQRYLVPAITVKSADDLVDRARLRPEDVVLDVACGTGVVARAAAGRASQGQVTGLDLNSAMLAVARRVTEAGASIRWVQGTALDLPFPPGSFDAVLCQLGVQFFPDRGRAVGEMLRVLKATGRAAVSVYSPIERTPGAHAFVRALDEVLGMGASTIKRSEHSFESPAQLETLLKRSGFKAVDVRVVEQAIAFPSVLDYVRFQLVATPMAVLLKEKTVPERRAVMASVASRTASFTRPALLPGDAFSFPQEAYVATARR